MIRSELLPCVVIVVLCISDLSLAMENSTELPKASIGSETSDSFTEFVAKMGYPVEIVSVVTEDNYVLRVHRLPQDRPTNKVALILHGLLSSSLDWVLIGRNKSIALLLHDMGYDVWLGNARGNAYSRAHLNISTTSKAFWDFSWHEIGYFDMSAMIETILETANVQQLDYIGHSQGFTSFLVLCILRPEYQKYFRTVIAMSPIAFLANIDNSYLQILSKNSHTIESMLNRLKIYEVIPSNGVPATLSKLFCRESSPSQDLCANLLFLTVGPGNVFLNKTLLPNLLHNVHAGISTKQLLHFAHLINSGRFQQFDYRDQNMAIYNSDTPPDYSLQAITGMDLHLYYGTKDTFMGKRDVLRLVDNLQYTNTVHITEIPDFNHLDYIFGSNVTDILYQSVLRVMMDNNFED